MSERWQPLPEPAWGRGAAVLAPVPLTAVVVGVAHDGRSGAALEWAAAEAAARKVPLRIVHAFWIPLLADPWGALSVPPQTGRALAAARIVLDAARSHALLIAPDLQVSTHHRSGSRADALLAEGATDALLVMGAETHRVSAVRVKSPAAARIAGKAHVPLVVVTLAEHASPGSSRGRVVVGVAQVGSSGEALAFAFDAARRRRTGLTAVRAWSPVRSDTRWVEHAISEREQHEQLGRLLRPYDDAFPDVDVRQRVLPLSPSKALLDEADGASLVVLGSTHHRRLTRVRSGQVRRALLQSAHTPVVIVPPVDARARGSSWWRRTVMGSPPTTR